jgi:hypothetical protein
MEKNPYKFSRSWTVEVKESQSVNTVMSQREKQLEEKLQKIEKQFQDFQEQQNKILQAILNENSKGKGKGKGKGKKSTPTPTLIPSDQHSDFQVAVEQEAQRRLRSFIESNESLDQEASTSFEPSAPPPPSITSHWTDDALSLNSVNLTATKTIFIKKVEVTLNGIPLDLVEDKQTEDQVILKSNIIKYIYISTGGI